LSVRRLLTSIAVLSAIATGLTTRPALAETLHLEPDLVKSSIQATVAEPLGVMRDRPNATGNFRMSSGEIDGDPNSPGATGHVKLVIDATSYDSGSATRDRNVIHSALETAKYQTITFESTSLDSVQIDVPGVSGSATVVGKLTLHGQTRLIRVPIQVSMTTDGQFSAGGEITFNYEDYGIKAPELLFLISASNQVTVAFRILAQRPGAGSQPAQSRREPIDDGRPKMRLATRDPMR
jgi:polyisoprenoid-binding protein YceI